MTQTTKPNFAEPPKPSPGPYNAADAGWQYHLVVKGFNSGSNDFSVRASVHFFLEALFGVDNTAPVQYCYHRQVESGQTHEGRILRFSLVRNNQLAITPDEALQRFCDKFFEQLDNTAYNKLSDFGSLGFSPEQDRFKLFWYQAMFMWMHAFRLERLCNIEQNISIVNSRTDQNLGDWFPVWTGAALLSVALGTTYFFKLRGTKRQGKSVLDNRSINSAWVRRADSIMMTIAGSNEDTNNAQIIKNQVTDLCTIFISHADEAIKMMRGTSVNGQLEPVTHVKMLEKLMFLFETGFRTVTLSRQAVECFMAIRNTSLTTSMFALTEAGIGAYNAIGSFRQISELRSQPLEFTDGLIDNVKKIFGVIEQTPGEIRAAAERTNVINKLNFDGVIAGAQAAYGAFRFANSVFQAHTAHQEKQKWTNVALYISSSIRHTQMCELYLHWTYNSGNGVQAMAPEYLIVLEMMTRDLNASVPTPEQCTPEAIRERLNTHAGILEREKTEVSKSLGLD